MISDDLLYDSWVSSTCDDGVARPRKFGPRVGCETQWFLDNDHLGIEIPAKKNMVILAIFFYGLGLIAVDNFYVSWFMALGFWFF